MVVICNDTFPDDKEDLYKKYFELFPYSLSHFQKNSIKAIVDGNHSLVCCGTGNGKTVSGEFAIDFFINQGKRVIYTVPIRSLGNQKFYDFSKKFPHITFGLLTGEVKTFPNAQVLIMTQEILMNYLFLLNTNKDINHQLQFQIDIQNELAAVVVDECHFIMDENRGHAWESTFLMLPKNIQLIMLSATLDNPSKLALWIEKRYTEDVKEVVISSTEKRIVPLIHYMYLTSNESIFKKVKDKSIQQQINESTNRLLVIKNTEGSFIESTFHNVKKIKNIFENNQVYLKKSHVLNNIAKLLKHEELLPAIFYNFSRKNVEFCANEMTTNILEFDSKIPYTIRNETEQIIRKLPNFKEYINLPEYERLVRLMEKGVGYHHGGMIPVLREVVELFISKGYIKILFCTDSFSVGLNCPIKTTVFTGLTKFDGKCEDYLQPHLYTQCSGRAGRRGIDKIGHVIHCNNIFQIPDITSYKNILCGKPQKLESKFHISYKIILNIIKNASGIGNYEMFYSFIKKSMIYEEIQSSINGFQKEIDELVKQMDVKTLSITFLNTPICIIEQYDNLLSSLKKERNKKRKEIEKQINDIYVTYRSFQNDFDSYKDLLSLKNIIHIKTIELQRIENFIKDKITSICEVLVKEKLLLFEIDSFTFTQKGRMASQLAEIHPLIFSEYILQLHNFEVNEIIELLSCFTDIHVNEEMKIIDLSNFKNMKLKNIIHDINNSFLKYEDYEYEYDLCKDSCYTSNLVYDIIEDIEKWCIATDEECCRNIIQESLNIKGISLGDFSKAVLKISVINKELINVCEIEGLIDLQHKLSFIDQRILKYVCSNQSLYI